MLSLGVAGVLIAVYKPGAGSGNPVLGALLFILGFAQWYAWCDYPAGYCSLRWVRGLRPGLAFSLGGLMLCLTGIPAWFAFAELLTPQK